MMAWKLAFLIRSKRANHVRVGFQTTVCFMESNSNTTTITKNFSTFQRITVELPSVKLWNDMYHSQQLQQPRQHHRSYSHSARDNDSLSKTFTKPRRLLFVYYGFIYCSIGGGFYYFYQWIRRPQPPSAAHDLRRNSMVIADIVEKCTDAVVNVVIKDTQSSIISRGSGFIVDEDGLILTNAHVVQFAYPRFSMQIRLADGTVYPGIVEDMDVKSDLATIRIEPKAKLPVMKLGISKDLRPGESVIAMGSPLSLPSSITAGIVSSVNRTGAELGLPLEDMNYIQTDTLITFGNSGGPLINLDGQVVGITTLMASVGFGFAIPSDYVRLFLEKSLSRPSKDITASSFERYRGVIILTLNEFTRQAYARLIPAGLTQGALVGNAVIGSPTHRSGLRKGDIIVQINGSLVKSSNAVYQALEKHGSLHMRIYRGNSYLDLLIRAEDVS